MPCPIVWRIFGRKRIIQHFLALNVMSVTAFFLGILETLVAMGVTLVVIVLIVANLRFDDETLKIVISGVVYPCAE